MPSSIRLATTVNKSRRKLEQIASTALASHTVTTLRTKGVVPPFSNLKAGKSLTNSLNASAYPQRKDLGHSPAFAIGFMARRATASPTAGPGSVPERRHVQRRQASECPNRSLPKAGPR